MTLTLAETYFALAGRTAVVPLAGALIVDLAAAGAITLEDGAPNFLGVPRTWATAAARPDDALLARAYDRVSRRSKAWTVANLSTSLIPEFLIRETWIERGWAESHRRLTADGEGVVASVTARWTALHGGATPTTREAVLAQLIGDELVVSDWRQHSDPRDSVPGRWDLVLRDVKLLDARS